MVRFENVKMKKKNIPLAIIGLIVASVMWMSPITLYQVTDFANRPFTQPQQGIILGSVNLIDNGGFETGDFTSWTNYGGTSYNQIQTSTVYSGTYALYMDSHLSSAPYETVYQEINTDIPLFEAQNFSFAVYPTKVGNTAGQAGADQVWFGVYNRTSDTHRNVFYEWSGYTYPGGDMDVNVTKVLYLLFDLTPNDWNFVERNLYDDYCAFYGTPENNTELVVNRITLLSHISNGDPGDFWIDDITIGAPEEVPVSTDYNYIENSGFETGSFSPWVNQGGTEYNQIVGSTVYNGSYSLYLDSHYSSSPYEPVTQRLSVNATLSEALTLSAVIYPTKVGNTCGQAGVSQIGILFHNTGTGQFSHIAYEWSGYTFPGNDLNSNSTYVRYLLFDWTPNSWNILNRSVYADYVAFWGVPSDPSQIEIYDVRLLCHSSNGDPGDFYIDNVYLGNGQPPTPEPEPTTTTTTTTTTTSETTSTGTGTTYTTTSPTDTYTDTSSSSSTTPSNVTLPNGNWFMMVFVGGGGMGVIIIVIIIILTKKGGSPGSTSVPYEW